MINYDGFMEPVSWFLTGMEKHSDNRDTGLRGSDAHLWDKVSLIMAKLSEFSLHTAMNQLSNHSHSRSPTRTNGRVGRFTEFGSAVAEEGVQPFVMRRAALVLFTRSGVSTIYYGDEAGICGFTDPDSQRSHPWGHENLKPPEYRRYSNKLHHSSVALRHGPLIPLLMKQDPVCYGRVYGRGQVLTFVYTGTGERLFRLPYWKLADSTPQRVKCVMLTYESGYNVGYVHYVLENSMILVHVTQDSAGIYLGMAPS